MIPAETIAELKVSHADAWQQKRTAGLNEQQTAQVILSQIEIDNANPPEAEALKRVHSARGATKAQRQRFREALASHKRIAEEVAALFPGIDAGSFRIEMEDDDADLTGLNKVLEEHRELVAQQNERIKELEDFLDEQGKQLALKAERVKQLEDGSKALDADLREAMEKAAEREQHVRGLEADLRAAQDALKPAPKAKK
jgi:phage-related protein